MDRSEPKEKYEMESDEDRTEKIKEAERDNEDLNDEEYQGVKAPVRIKIKRVLRLRLDYIAAAFGSGIVVIALSTGLFLWMNKYALETANDGSNVWYDGSGYPIPEEALTEDEEDTSAETEDTDDLLWVRDNYKPDRMPSFLVTVYDELGGQQYYQVHTTASGISEREEIAEGLGFYLYDPEPPLFPSHFIGTKDGAILDYNLNDGKFYPIEFEGEALTVDENQWIRALQSISNREKFLITHVTTEEPENLNAPYPEVIEYVVYEYDASDRSVSVCENCLEFNMFGVGIEWYDSEHNRTINYASGEPIDRMLPLTVQDMNTGVETVLLDWEGAGIEEGTYTNTFGRDTVSNSIYYWIPDNPQVLRIFNLNNETITEEVVTITDEVIATLREGVGEDDYFWLGNISLLPALNKIVIQVSTENSSVWVGELRDNVVGSVVKVAQEEENDYLRSLQVLENTLFFEYQVDINQYGEGSLYYVRYYNLESGLRGQFEFLDTFWLSILSY